MHGISTVLVKTLVDLVTQSKLAVGMNMIGTVPSHFSIETEM